MLRTLLCISSVVAMLVTSSAFATVTESGTASFDNVAVGADLSEFGSVIYDKNNGPITITGTITDWNGDVQSDWTGLWPSIALTPTHYFYLSGTTVTGYAHLGDSSYGDKSHQMGLAALGLVFWQKSDNMSSEFQSHESGKTPVNSEPVTGTTYDFELVYDFDAQTMSATFNGSDVVSKDISADLALSDTFLLQVFCTNNDPNNLDMGFDLSYEVSNSELVPGDANNDGKVDGSDVTILAGNWQVGVGGVGGASWSMGDFNGDGAVDGSDVTILAGNWQYGVETAASAVPEPGTIVLLLAALASLFIVRRR